MAKVESERGANCLNDPDLRKKFKSSLAGLTEYLQKIDDFKEGLREAINAVSLEYGVEKKHVRKLANTMFKHNYESLQEETRHFEALYELIIEGKLRDDSDGDPLED